MADSVSKHGGEAAAEGVGVPGIGAVRWERVVTANLEPTQKPWYPSVLHNHWTISALVNHPFCNILQASTNLIG